MLKKTLILLPILTLAACASPREQCIAGANRSVATLDRLIVETRGNVQRGFALREVQDVRVVNSTCTGRNEDGTEFRFGCEETQTRTRNEPVSIDIAEEQRKLAQLEERRTIQARAANAQIQQCIAANPE
jgi:hypothetical protein